LEKPTVSTNWEWVVAVDHIDIFTITTRKQNVGKPAKRLTIGYITPQIEDEVGFAFYSGVARVAKKHGVNLICFVGGILQDPQGFHAEANTLYNLVSAERVDGLISWTSSMGTYMDTETLRKFYERFYPLPIVSLGQNFPGIPSVYKEDAQSMQALMAHLIEVHGYRRIALIRGPEHHRTAQTLYDAYIEALKSYGIPVDPRLVAPPGDWAQSTGGEMIRVLFDERRLQPKGDIEVVVGASDLLALGALKSLKERGIQVPAEVAVAGLNDSKEARAANPLLTSVTVPFRELVNHATELLMAMIAGRDVPVQTALPTKLVVRRSCGCASQSVLQVSARVATETGNHGPASQDNLGAMLPSRRTVVVSEMVQALRVYTGEGVYRWAEQVLDAFVAELQGKTDNFLATLEDILNQATIVGSNLTVWQRALSVMRHHLLPFIEPGGLVQAEDLWQQGRVLIGEIAQHMQLAQQFQTEQQSQVLQEISQTLMTSFELTELMDVLAQKLPQLDIFGCYLSLYENPDFPGGWARLMLAYNETGRIRLRPAGRRFPAKELVPTDLLPPEQRSTLVVEPLYFQNEQQGFVVFEGAIETGQIFKALCRQISSVLKGSQLFKQNVELYNEALQARIIAERADQLKTRLLANVTHELRNPLDIILGYTNLAFKELQSPDTVLPSNLLAGLTHIHNNAEYLQRVINDLLDLSRAEIDELDLNLELINTQKFLADIFQDMAEGPNSADSVEWHLQLPNRLPIIQADPVRLRQILLNLLGNARKFTDKGQIELGAEVIPPHIHIWVQDTGIGIPTHMQEQIFEPFVTGEKTGQNTAGMGLGLSITRRLVILHRGLIHLESQPDQGSTFHVYLPLPSLGDQPASFKSFKPSPESVILVISTQNQPPNEIINLSRRQGLEIRQLQIDDDLEKVLAEVQPAALAWDFADAPPNDWLIMQQLRNIPRLSQIPFILYRQEKGNESQTTTGLTNLLVKPVAGETLLDAINALCPPEVTDPILIVDDDPQICELYRGMVAKSLPGFPIEIAHNGVVALEKMAQTIPSLVILDLIMPEKDGFDVLEQMRANEQTRYVPVLVLSGHSLTLDDVKRLEQHDLVTLQSKGILSEVEAMAMLHRALFDNDTLPPHTSALVKRTIAYFHQHYENTLTRQEIAEAVGVNKDYLGQIFRQELGLSPWEYLNRYRIVHAKALLRNSKKSITAVSFLVGFNDPSYFGRVFRKQVGLSPRVYRKQAR